MFFFWIIFGAFVGWIASIITKKNRRMGLIANIVVGLLGSLLGSWIASLIGIKSFQRFSFAGFLISLSGSIVLLTLIKLIRGK